MTELLPTDSSLVAPDSVLRVQHSDIALVAFWLHGRSVRTKRAYEADARRLLDHTGKSLRELTLGDMQQFADSLAHLAQSSQARTLSAVKSLLTFGHKTGYLPINVGALLRLPKHKD